MKKLEKWEKIFLGVVGGLGGFMLSSYIGYEWIILPITIAIIYYFLKEDKK